MRIAVDAMGGDNGPEEVLRGVLDAAQRSQTTFYVVGDPASLEPVLARVRSRPGNVEIVAASEVIEMGEQPTVALRRKPNASMVVAARMVKEQRADALVSIGNTGAVMAVSLLTLGRIRGIDRPAIATPLPSLTGTVLLLDAGATVDCDPNNLYEFAIMGCVYAQSLMGITKPRVGLISNGEEPGKGNELVKRTHALFKEAATEDCAFQFIGNVEGRDIFRGNVDVVVCDGFVGNVILKTGEGVAEMVLKLMREEVGRHVWLKPFVAPLMPALRRLKRRIDYAERGGAPLLGVNGICIIGHGRSDAYAIANACRAAESAIRHGVIATIRERVCDVDMPPPIA
jgi:glycerol-3-phosphate acyltransferase PlsX